MKIERFKDSDHSYLVVNEVAHFNDSLFSVKMLKSGSISSLLSFGSETLNGETRLLYDISGKQSFEKIYENEPLPQQALRSLISSLSSLSNTLTDYLLDTDHVLFSADTIFIEKSSFSFYYCYVPCESFDFHEQVKELFNKILSLIDYDDPACVALAFTLNKTVQNENFTFSELQQKCAACSLNIPDYNGGFDSFETENGKYEAESADTITDVPVLSHGAARPACFKEKLKRYFAGKTFQDVFDDINSGHIFRKITEKE